jgi:uncharacterized protein
MSCCGGAAEFSEVGGQALARLITFARTLRDNAFAIGLKETQDAAKVVASGLAERPSSLRPALKALFCARRSDWQRFDEIFDAHWLGRGVKRLAQVSAAQASTSPKTVREMSTSDKRNDGEPGLPEPVTANDNTEDGPPGNPGQTRMEGASRIANLAHTDFRKISDPAALAEAHAIAERLAKAMRARLTRRDRAHRRGRKIDLRRTIRRNIAHGGVPIELVHRKPKQKPLRLVVLLDASGSMSLYTTVFVRFIHGVLEHFHDSEAFLFHTHLAHVTPAMRERDGTRALDRLSLLAGGVGGGTRIGESLATFNRWHAKRVIHSRTCVMILSDGYETGDVAALGAQMRQLAKRCRRIVWLNPMMGWDGYEPTASGMQAALEHVNLFAPAHTLDSLAKLEPYLARL